MSESGAAADVPKPVRTFLAQDADSLLLQPGAAAPPGRHPRVAVVVADRGALRRYAVPAGVRSATVAVFLRAGVAAPSLVPRPEWPVVLGLRSRRASGGWLVVLRFTRPVEVAAVVAELGRQSVVPDRAGHGGLWVQAAARLSDDVPVDVAVTDTGEAVEPHPVTGRPPVRLAELTEAPGPLRLGPLDERVLNPIGFDPGASGPVVALSTLDLRRGPTEELVTSLRGAAGVRVDGWGPGPGVEPVAGVVAGLAMAGVPVVAAEVPEDVAALLGQAVPAALAAPVDLADPLAREEHSIELRRAALTAYSSFGWRAEVGRRSGIPVAVQPAVSVVLATRRPSQLDFALRQVARQRDVDRLELVLAPHGFAVDEGVVREALPASVASQVVPRPAETLFGEVLADAARASRGDVVLKMDDDDWYAPDFVADLLLARAYSGAGLVGMPAELHYLAPRDLTVKRGHSVERYARFVAGGTMMVDRDLLREAGGFRPVRRYVDAQLLAAVAAAGGTVYRSHGLGYVLRRGETGHTWQASVEELLDPARVAAQWPGFRPSRLLEPDPRDLPPGGASSGM